jgi:plasmid stabilization system protein ParE
MKPVVLTPDAQAELEGAADWYESRLEGLALKFLLHVHEALQTIEETPSGFPRWEHDSRFRKVVLQRFPYVIFYRELHDRIEVVAIAHGAREPGYWRKRK